MSRNDQKNPLDPDRMNQDDSDRSSERGEESVIAQGRPSQSVDRPPRSDLWRRVSADRLNRTDLRPRELVRGRDSGRNLMGYFGQDEILRTLYPLRLRGGRPRNAFGGAARGYPAADTIIPLGTSLRDIIRHYPLHVWGDGLRLFMAEGWSATKVYKRLPAVAKHGEGKKARPWNYMQEAFERQMLAMNDEQVKIDAEATEGIERTPDREPNEEQQSGHKRSMSPEPTPETAATGIIDPQLQDNSQPLEVRPTIPQLQARIELEHELLFAAFVARRRLIIPGFANMTIQDQHAEASDRLGRHFAAWEAQILQTLPSHLHNLVTVQYTGFLREIQILRGILQERLRTAIHPAAGVQPYNTDWQAHQDLLNQIRSWRRGVESHLARVRESQGQSDHTDPSQRSG